MTCYLGYKNKQNNLVIFDYNKIVVNINIIYTHIITLSKNLLLEICGIFLWLHPYLLTDSPWLKGNVIINVGLRVHKKKA